MNIKSKISLLSTVALLSFGTLNAQNKVDNKARSNNAALESEYKEMDEDREAKKLQRLSEELNLDATQKEKIERLLVKRKREMDQFREERKEKREELRNDESGSDDYTKQKRKIMEDRKELHEEFKSDLREILNDEQYARFEEIEKEHKVQRKEKFHNKKQKDSKMKPHKQERQYENK